MVFCQTITLQKDNKFAFTFMGNFCCCYCFCLIGFGWFFLFLFCNFFPFFLSLENGTGDHFIASLYTQLQFMNGTGLGLLLSTGQIKLIHSS